MFSSFGKYFSFSILVFLFCVCLHCYVGDPGDPGDPGVFQFWAVFSFFILVFLFCVCLPCYVGDPGDPGDPGDVQVFLYVYSGAFSCVHTSKVIPTKN